MEYSAMFKLMPTIFTRVVIGSFDSICTVHIDRYTMITYAHPCNSTNKIKLHKVHE